MLLVATVTKGLTLARHGSDARAEGKAAFAQESVGLEAALQIMTVALER